MMITMLELYEKIKEGTQPFSIVYDDEYYYWTDENEEGYFEGNYVTADRCRLQMSPEKSINEIIRNQIIDSEPLISRKERNYLKTVVSPFHDRVKGVMKTCPSREEGGREAISISYTGDDVVESVFKLPSFECGSCFKGMELWKNYKLPDLHIQFTEDDEYDEEDDEETQLRIMFDEDND